MPKVLFDIEVPEEHYIMRSRTFFGDIIQGHPMASDGWYAESLAELIELELLD